MICAPAEASHFPDSLTCVTQHSGLKDAQGLFAADVCLISALISSKPSCTEYRL